MVHTFYNNGYYIALDVNSGSIHCIDELTYKILNEYKDGLPDKQAVADSFKSESSEAVSEIYDELKDLQQKGMLFSEDFDESLLKKVYKDNGIKALCLNIAHDCNLRCEYCFASKGDYKTGRELMSEEVALKSLDLLAQNSGTRKNIEVDFFGGEPMLNFDVVKKAIDYGRKIESKYNKKFHFTITTNATLLNDEKIDYLNENMDNVVLSLDGRKEINDFMRHDVHGNGSHDKIVEAAKKLVSKRGEKQYFVRGTYTTRNLDFAKDALYIADLGFKEISVEPVVGKGEYFHIKEENLPYILDQYDKLASEYIKRHNEGKGFRFYHFNINLYGGPCIYRRIVACGAGYDYLAVAPNGDIYPCHQFVGENDLKMGTVFDGIKNRELQNKFKKANVFTKEKCKNCWAKYFCSGGCPANSYFTNGSIKDPDDIACTMQKKRIECAIMINIAFSGKMDEFKYDCSMC